MYIPPANRAYSTPQQQSSLSNAQKNPFHQEGNLHCCTTTYPNAHLRMVQPCRWLSMPMLRCC